jgi:hypothetical protein
VLLDRLLRHAVVHQLEEAELLPGLHDVVDNVRAAEVHDGEGDGGIVELIVAAGGTLLRWEHVLVRHRS